jgi:halocyanin-like protein
MKDFSRRRFVLGTAAAAATGALAGCSGNGGGNGNGNGNGNGEGNGNGAAEGPEARASSFLGDNDANLYEGSLEDMTGEDEVTISVGAGDNGFSFDPSGITVSTGTNVVWEWTGNGGAHNVVSEDGSDYEVESELTDEEGYTMEQTVDEAGAILYVCVPHRAQGMYGAVAVVDE